MLKIYKFTRWGLILPVLFTIVGAGMIYFSEELKFRAGGILLLGFSGCLFWLVIVGMKFRGIRIEKDSIVFPSYTLLGRPIERRVKWQDILAIYTLTEQVYVETYLVPRLKTDRKSFNDEINMELKKGKQSKKAKEYLEYLKWTHKLIEVPRCVNNYRALLKDICEMAAEATIDEDTKMRAQGKEHLINLSDGTRRVLEKIFRVKRSDSETYTKDREETVLSEQGNRCQNAKTFLNKPINPNWLVLISFVFSFLLAGLMAYRNYVLFGKPKKWAILILFATIVISGVFVLVTYLHPLDKPIGAILAINLIVGIIMACTQRKDYIEWKIKQRANEKHVLSPG